MRAGTKHLLDSRWGHALPIGADHHVIAGFAAGGSAADVTEVVGIAIDELQRVVTLFLHRWHREHDRLAAQVHEQHGIRRVAVRRNNGRVLISSDMVQAMDLVERSLVLAGVLVDGVVVHDRIVHHDGQAVDVALLRDGLRFGRSGVRGMGERECKGREQYHCAAKCSR
ncbi:hypothetical protein D3C85_1046820 [compost metagenome]